MTKPIVPLDLFDEQRFLVSDTWQPDLSEVLPQTLKEWAVPIPYTVLLSPNFEVEPRPFEDELLAMASDRPDDAFLDLRVPGPTDGTALYERLFPAFSAAFGDLVAQGKASPEGPLLAVREPVVLAHPFKLAAYLAVYSAEMESNFEVRDKLSELLDKLFLIGVLPHVFSNLGHYLQLTDAQEVKQTSARGFLDSIEEGLGKRRNKLLSSAEFFGEDSYLEIAQKEFVDLLSKGQGFDQHDQLLVPISQLDELFSDQVAKRYTQFVERSRQRADGGAKALIDLVAGWPAEDVVLMRRPTATLGLPGADTETLATQIVPIDIGHHYWLYRPIRRALSGDFIHGLSLNTLEFNHDGFAPPPTVTDDIDLRPAVWARQTFALAGDLLVLRKRTDLGRRLMEEAKDLEEISDVDTTFLGDWQRLGGSLAELDALRGEISEYGYDLDLEAANDSSKTKLGLFRTRRYQYQQRVIRYRIKTIRHKRRVGPFWRRRTKRWTTRHRVPYYATITKVREEQVPIALDWDPVSTYLDQPIDSAVYTIENSRGERDETRSQAELQALREAIRQLRGESVPEGQTPRNRDKDYRVFSISNDQMTDQYGNPLDAVMQQAENLAARRLLLLLLPVVERDEFGLNSVVAYKAIHNPVGFRNSYSTPEVAVLEELEQRVRESPEYFVGPLAHTETLLPGERRSLTVRSESGSTLTTNRSTSQTIETASKSSSSIKDQLRREVTKISRRSQQTSWSVSASGGANIGFAKVGGSASSSGTSTRSTEDKVSNLNDHVTQVMNEVSQRNEVTITTASTESETFTTSREQRIDIENYNTGRSVTHRFHQVLRRFESLTRLQNVRILVTYDREFVAGYGYRSAEIIRLEDLDQLLPEFVEEERVPLIAALRDQIVARYEAIELDEATATLALPKDGIELPASKWHVNSGSYIIETDLAGNEVLEDYVARAREAQTQRTEAERALLDSQAKAIEAGRVVYPARVDELRLTAPLVDRDE